MATDASPQVTRTERDGVRVLWAPAPGPVFGALLFRSGKVDEGLPIGGINHLVEHMALFPIGRPAYKYNGRVEDVFTLFYAEGRPDEVAGFLSEVAGNLADLPIDRLPVERRILETEAQGHDPGLDGRLLSLRYGPAGFGMVYQAEMGLGWLDGERVRAWAAERFTKGNAIVFMTGEPPDDLTLPLPDGPAIHPPAPDPIPGLKLPATLEQGTGGIALTVQTTRSSAITIGFSAAAERGHERLRREAGLSYAVNMGYEILDATTAHVVLQADCRDHDAARVRDELLAVADELAADGPTDEEMATDREQLARLREDPVSATMTELDSMARDLLLGAEFSTLAELAEEREALDAAAVATAVRESLDSLFVLVPSGTGGRDKRRFAEYDPARDDKLEGTLYVPTLQWREWGEATTITVAPKGVTLADEHGLTPLTVRYDECVAAVTLLSGGLTLVDRSNAFITISPSIYQDGYEAVQTAMDHVPRERWAPLTEQEERILPTVREQLPQTIRDQVPRELDVLASALAGDEEISLMARVTRGKQVGLLTLTDRRLLYLFVGANGTDVLDVPLRDVRGAAVKGLLNKKLVLTIEGETVELTDVAPAERMAEAAGILTSR